MSKIFLSYRRNDSSGHTGRLYDALSSEFGPNSVFYDKSSVEPGSEWIEKLAHELQRAELVIIIIGSHWLDELNVRLDQPDDYVRLEIATALQTGKKIIPVLVAGAQLPLSSALPADINAFLTHQALPLSDASDNAYKNDLSRLLATVERITPSLNTETEILQGSAMLSRSTIFDEVKGHITLTSKYLRFEADALNIATASLNIRVTHIRSVVKTTKVFGLVEGLELTTTSGEKYVFRQADNADRIVQEIDRLNAE